jgi:D-alanine-D-alanine ligase-like ATP-grasp enzyme
VLLESYHEGQDLRIVVIGFHVVAAAIRKPPEIIGDGEHSIEILIEKLSRRRSASSQGKSSIPIDNDTHTCLAEQGYALDDVPPPGTLIRVRKTANFHTGGTIHDVTEHLHPALVTAVKGRATSVHPRRRSRLHRKDPLPRRLRHHRGERARRAWPTMNLSPPPSASSTCCSRCPRPWSEIRRKRAR